MEKSWKTSEGKHRESGQRISGQFRNRGILIRDVLWHGKVSVHRSEHDVINEDLAILDFQVQRFLLAVADCQTELLEFHENRRDVVFLKRCETVFGGISFIDPIPYPHQAEGAASSTNFLFSASRPIRASPQAES